MRGEVVLVSKHRSAGRFRTAQFPVPASLNACLNARGLYNSFQFVLRLSPEIHRRIAHLPTGITTRPVDPETIQAFSTYLHETIHWWQHIGSTMGLLLSLTYPAQAHANHHHLKNLLAAAGPQKSIYKLVETQALSGAGNPETPGGLANVHSSTTISTLNPCRLLITSAVCSAGCGGKPLV